ncbi:MAG: recombination mediator RecR [Alphaproteobacteria bacterium]|tara:strand:+ start:61 stop:660 length:600 start_codon:yes stop_codon:yes gene_type:complete
MSSLTDLVNIFSKLPSLGPRSARRIVLHILKHKQSFIPLLISTLEKIKSELIFCKSCGNIDLTDPCNICSNKKRNEEKICVVEDIADLWAIEKSNAFDGKYHVLGGVLSAMDGIGPDELNINSLFNRLKDNSVKEVIIATNVTTEGQITGQYIADECLKIGVLVTKLAQGIPIGGELEMLDYNTMSTAFTSRLEVKITN